MPFSRRHEFEDVLKFSLYRICIVNMYLVCELVDSKVVGLLSLLVLVVVLSDVVEVVDEDLPSLELYLSRLVLSVVRCLENITNS